MTLFRRRKGPALDMDYRTAWHWCGLVKRFMHETVEQEERNQCRAKEETQEFLRSKKFQ